jgi:hypothetical protein
MQEESVGRRVWRFFVPVVILVPIIAIGAGVSFLFVGEFSARAYSDRLFWGGIGAAIIGGFAVVASLGAYNTLGTPSVLTAGSDSRIAHERVADYLRMNAGRYTFVLRMVLSGAICIGAAALVDFFAR